MLGSGSVVANTAGKYSCPCLGSVGVCLLRTALLRHIQHPIPWHFPGQEGFLLRAAWAPGSIFPSLGQKSMSGLAVPGTTVIPREEGMAGSLWHCLQGDPCA